MWVRIRALYGIFLEQHGPHMGYHYIYKAQMGFSNGLAWVPHEFIYGTHKGPFWDKIGPYGGPVCNFQLYLARVQHGFRYRTHMGPLHDNIGPMRAYIMAPRWALHIILAWVPVMWLDMVSTGDFLGQHLPHITFH